jgi:hypothetical protein
MATVWKLAVSAKIIPSTKYYHGELSPQHLLWDCMVESAIN